MNKFSTPGLNSSLSLGTHTNLRLTYSHISNIQKFLNKYKKISSEKVPQLEIDEKDQEVYSSDSVLPDIYLKTRTPIDRNKMYIFWEDRNRRKSNRGKVRNEGGMDFSNSHSHKRNYPSKYDRGQSQGNIDSVYFPL
jgi:hypothetical protein